MAFTRSKYNDVYNALKDNNQDAMRSIINKFPSLKSEMIRLDESGDTHSLPLLFHAVYRSNLSMLRFLVKELEFDPNIINTTNGDTLLHCLVIKILFLGNFEEDVLLFVLENCNNINNTNNYHNTPFNFFVRSSEREARAEEIILLMLNNGCLPSVNIADSFNNIPIMNSHLRDKINMMMLTRENVNHINASGRPYLSSILDIYVDINIKDMVIKCLECGADPNFRFNGEDFGQYLRMAYTQRSEELFRLLLRYGAKLDPQNRIYFSAQQNDNGVGKKFIDIVDNSEIALILMSPKNIDRLRLNTKFERVDSDVIRRLVKSFLVNS
jgi:hypothetical protein